MKLLYITNGIKGAAGLERVLAITMLFLRFHSLALSGVNSTNLLKLLAKKFIIKNLIEILALLM